MVLGWSFRTFLGLSKKLKKEHIQQYRPDDPLWESIHHDSDSPFWVQSKRVGITNSIVRAEPAAIAAAILQDHSYMATGSPSSLHQIGKIVSRASASACPRPHP
eukprot:1160655-Pelagomonas_calceolata.AAC.1